MLSCHFCEILRLYALLPHTCFFSFPLTNLQEGELCQIYTIFTDTYSSLLNHLEFSQKWVLDVDLKVVTNKDQSKNIYDICNFEEIMDNLFQERSNIDASLAALLEFSQLVCFT